VSGIGFKRSTFGGIVHFSRTNAWHKEAEEDNYTTSLMIASVCSTTFLGEYQNENE
jgi:hypothetical protein